jgi:hypothetical protein
MSAKTLGIVVRVWLGAGLIIGIMMWQQGGRWLPTGDPAKDAVMKPRADLMILYGAGLVMRQAPGSLYDQQQEAAAQSAATGLEIAVDDPDFLPYSYPATTALAMTPLTLLSYRTAYGVVMFINFVLLGITIALLCSHLKIDSRESNVLVLGAAAFLPVYGVFVHGQITFLLLLLYTLVIVDLREEKFERAGLWCGLTALKPTLLPVFLLWLAVRRRWRTFGWAVTIAGAMALASVLLVGMNGTWAYMDQAGKLARGEIHTAPLTAMYNLNAIVHFFDGGSAAWVLASIAVLGLVLVTGRWDSANDWSYCALISGSILLAPYVLINELNAMLIVVALIAARSNRKAPALWRWTLLLLMLVPTACFAAFGTAGASVVALMLLGFFGVFIFCGFRESRQWSAIASGRADGRGYA